MHFKIGELRNLYRRIVGKRLGLIGSAILVIAGLLSLLRAAGDIEFFIQQWPNVYVFLLNWGPLIGFLVGAALVAKAVYETSDFIATSSATSARARSLCNRPTPDEWLREGIVFAVERRWMGPNEEALTSTDKKERAADLFVDVRQLARNGKLTIFGKLWENSTWDPIHPDYWANHEISAIELFRTSNPEQSVTSSATPDGKGPIYKSLRINKAQFEQLWSPTVGEKL